MLPPHLPTTYIFTHDFFFTDHPSDYGGQRCGCHGEDRQREDCGLPGADAGAAEGALFQGCACTHLVPDQGAGTADLKIYKRGWLCFIVLKNKTNKQTKTILIIITKF